MAMIFKKCCTTQHIRYVPVTNTQDTTNRFNNNISANNSVSVYFSITEFNCLIVLQ